MFVVNIQGSHRVLQTVRSRRLGDILVFVKIRERLQLVERRLAEEHPDQSELLLEREFEQVGVLGEIIAGGDMLALPAVPERPVVVGAADIVAHHLAAEAEVGAHVLAIGRNIARTTPSSPR